MNNSKELSKFDLNFCQNQIKKLQLKSFPIFDQLILYVSNKDAMFPNSKSLKQLKELGDIPNLELDRILNGVDRCEK